MKPKAFLTIVSSLILFAAHPPSLAAAGGPELTLDSIIGDTRAAALETVSVACTADGHIYLMMRNNRISIFDATGHYIRSQTSPRPVRWPRYDTYLTGIESRIFVGELHLDYPWVFDGEKGDRPGEFRQPADAVTDAAGRTWVADRGNHRIQVFNEGEHKTPWKVIAVDGAPVSVVVQGKRMATATAEGILYLFAIEAADIRQIASLKTGGNPKDLCFTPSGDTLCCFVGGWAGQSLRRYSFHDEKLQQIGVIAPSYRNQWPNLFPSSVVISPGKDRKSVLFAAREEGQVLEMGLGSNTITELVRGCPRPLSACYDPSGNLLVGCAMTKRDGPGVVVFKYTRGPNGFEKSETIPREGSFSTSFNSNLLTSVLPTADGGVYVRVVENDNWTHFQIKKLYPEGRLADWLDLGKELYAKVKRYGPSGWSYGLQRYDEGQIIGAFRIIGSVAMLTPEGKTIWQSGCIQAGGGQRIDFGSVSDVAVDSRGNVWVIDSERDRLTCLDGKTGRQIWQYGAHGGVDERDGKHFNQPTGVEVGQYNGVEHLLLGDAGNQRIITFRLGYGQ